MTRSEQLEKVKQSLNIMGNALDNPLGLLLDDVKLYMSDAGVMASVIASESAIGAICRGVADLYIDNELSTYFYQRVTQLAQVCGYQCEKKWVAFCGVTADMPLSPEDEEMEYIRTIYRKGEELKINYEAIVIPDGYIPANMQLHIATIDNMMACPTETMCCPGTVIIGQKIYSATYRVWEYGEITMVTEAAFSAGEEVYMVFNGHWSLNG